MLLPSCAVQAFRGPVARREAGLSKGGAGPCSSGQKWAAASKEAHTSGSACGLQVLRAAAAPCGRCLHGSTAHKEARDAFPGRAGIAGAVHTPQALVACPGAGGVDGRAGGVVPLAGVRDTPRLVWVLHRAVCRVEAVHLLQKARRGAGRPRPLLARDVCCRWVACRVSKGACFLPWRRYSRPWGNLRPNLIRAHPKPPSGAHNPSSCSGCKQLTRPRPPCAGC